MIEQDINDLQLRVSIIEGNMSLLRIVIENKLGKDINELIKETKEDTKKDGKETRTKARIKEE